MQLKFKVREHIWKEEDVLERISKIVCGNPQPFRQETGYKWRLNGSNDWWLDYEDGEYILAYRYGNAKLEKAFKVILDHIFN